MKTFFTLDDIDGVINVVDDVTREYETANLEVIYDDLQWRLLEHFEKLADKGKVATVVNSWDGEVEEWEGDQDYEKMW